MFMVSPLSSAPAKTHQNFCGVRLTNSKWSTPTLKARWYDDESIAALGVVVEGDVEGDVEGVGSAADLQGARQNTLKAGPSDVPHVAVSTQAPVYRPASTGEPPTG
jgi:hypothetical protein